LQAAVSSHVHIIKGQIYEVHRYLPEKGPNRDETIAMAKDGRELLTAEEARAIKKDPESNVAFRKMMKYGEWCYVRDPESEARPRASFAKLHNSTYLNVMVNVPIDGRGAPAPIVILKIKNKTA
jgi:hypothetical protein